MKNSLRKWSNNYFYFQKKDRNGIIILVALILIVIISNIITRNFQPKSKYNYEEIAREFNEWEKSKESNLVLDKYLFPFDPNTISANRLDSLNIPQFVKQNIINYRNAGGNFSNTEQLRKIYGMNDSIYSILKNYIEIPEREPYDGNREIIISKKVELSGFFDPNTADINTLMKYGFNRFQAENIIKYRESGGGFKEKRDLIKIYGIDSIFFNTIKDHVKIEEISVIEEELLVLIELNKADSIQLMDMEGVGPVFAGRILKYRELLGGFYSKTQLLEVYNFPPETYHRIENQLITDTLHIKKIRINYAEYRDLIKHPYLDKEQVNKILKFRNEHGAITNLNQIQTLFSVDAEKFKRILPYITCH